MTADAKRFLDKFHALSDEEKWEALVGILRLSGDLGSGKLTDEQAGMIADGVCAQYNAEEDAK